MLICLHGLVIDCKAPNAGLIAQLVRPYKLYVTDEGSPECTIQIVQEDPPYQQFPNIEASYSTPRNMVYDSKALRVVDYFGKGAVVEDKTGQIFTIYGVDTNFLQEAFYLLVLSLFGQHCDKVGMLRIHAMALSYADKAILMPVPQGGGKSTMAFAMLQEDGFKLISDDEPIVSQSGSILPFTLRIGTLDKQKLESIPEEFVYSIDRMEFGLKYFIDVNYWKPQLETRALDDIIYVTSRRVLNGSPSVREIPKYRAAKSLVRDAIVGIGLYQGLEFLLGRSAWTTISKTGTVFKRSVSAWRMMRRARTFELTLSRDIGENRRVFSEFIRELEEKSP
jgi:hypothetical protein